METVPENQTVATGVSLGLRTCRVCGQTSRLPMHLLAAAACCPYCHARLPARKADSLARAWALLLAALICYFPANILPIMDTRSLFGQQLDTILSGVAYLWNSGSWPLALVVFVASILVPLVKMLCLGYLLLSVQFNWQASPLSRTRLYRLLEIVGPWSMLDIYVVGLLVALVQWQGLASVRPGPAALAFAAVVVLTMLAAQAFDPRLIWDRTKGDGQ